MKKLFTLVVIATSMTLFSCGGNGTGDAKKNEDSVHSGLEGTREDASQLSNSTIDTSAGKTTKKTNDSTSGKDTMKR